MSLRTINLLLALLLPAGSLSAATPAERVKTAYIYRFTQFVSWPESPAVSDAPFTICLWGQSSISREFPLLARRQAGKRPIHISYPKTLHDAAACQILYLARSERVRFATVLKQLGRQPVLTISSAPGFAEDGGMIGFITANNRVRLVINRSAARRAGLHLSAKLLEVATLVGENIANDTHGESLP